MIDDELVYSEDASCTRFCFFKGQTRLNIFVEDSGHEYEYETIFEKMLDKQSERLGIFATGGKQNAILLFEELGPKNDDGSINIFIVDGDFDRYVEAEEMTKHPNFIYLEAYNIENYIIDENATVIFLKGKMRKRDLEVRNKLSFDSWKERIVGESKKLFCVYCFLKKYHPEIPNVDRSPYEFIDDKTGFERTDKSFEKYWNDIKSIDQNAEEKIEGLKEKYTEINGEDFFKFICGKFLFTSLCCYIKNFMVGTFKHDDFRWHLINNFDISKLNYVKDQIQNIRTVESTIV